MVDHLLSAIIPVIVMVILLAIGWAFRDRLLVEKHMASVDSLPHDQPTRAEYDNLWKLMETFHSDEMKAIGTLSTRIDNLVFTLATGGKVR